jgi:hypothetical protein
MAESDGPGIGQLNVNGWGARVIVDCKSLMGCVRNPDYPNCRILEYQLTTLRQNLQRVLPVRGC